MTAGFTAGVSSCAGGRRTVGLILADRANLWVAVRNADLRDLGGKVIKLRSSDGVNLGTFAMNWWPTGLTFDGTNIWVAKGYVVKLRASDGINLDTFAVYATALAFDGKNMWMAGPNSNIVTKR